MAISGVYGLDRFSQYMKGLEDCYAVIGGTACDIVLSNADLDFRATKDIDVILLVENRFPEVAAAVWRLVKDGGYECGWKSSEGVNFYRFVRPRIAGFPSMVELFSKAPSFIEKPDGLTVVPLPAGDEASSLSAILLDDDYYAYMKSGRKQSTASPFSMKSTLFPSRQRRSSTFRGGRSMARGSIRVTSRSTRKMSSGWLSFSPQAHRPFFQIRFAMIWKSSARRFAPKASL